MSVPPFKPGQRPANLSANPHAGQPKPVGELKEKTFGDDVGGKSNGFISFIKFFVNWIVIPLVIVFLFQALVFQAFYVSGQSMEPTYQDGDYLVISKIGITSQNLRHFFNKNATINYKRGDVLVFRPPIATSTFYIKRLIGLPGERVVINDGKITIYNKENPNGMLLHEPYDASAQTIGDIDVTVEKDKFFVLGDNREPSGSYDSRAWGQLPQANVTGHVVIRLLPLNRFRWEISSVNYAGLLQNPVGNILQLISRTKFDH